MLIQDAGPEIPDVQWVVETAATNGSDKLAFPAYVLTRIAEEGQVVPTVCLDLWHVSVDYG